MRLQITRGSAWALSVAALSTRLFLGISIDQPELQISGWISALVGVVLCLPMFWAGELLSRSIRDKSPEDLFKRTSGGLLRAFEGLLLAILLLDAAGIMFSIAVVADYATMTTMRPGTTILPLCLVSLWAMQGNGDGVGGAARLWLWIAPFLIGIVLIQHAKSYNFRWLTPILGSGNSAIALGCVSTAGWLSPGIAAWLIAEPEKAEARRKNMLLLPIWAGCLAAILLGFHASMLPAQVADEPTRVFLLDSIISNGRASIATQLPMTLLWISGLLSTLSFDLFLSAALLQRIFPRMDGRLSALLVIAGSAMLVFLDQAGQEEMFLLATREYLCVAVPFFLLLGIALFKSRRKAEPTCEDVE